MRILTQDTFLAAPIANVEVLKHQVPVDRPLPRQAEPSALKVCGQAAARGFRPTITRMRKERRQ